MSAKGHLAPAWSGPAATQDGRTPAWKHDQLGGRTPAYGADGGRTSYGFGGVSFPSSSRDLCTVY